MTKEKKPKASTSDVAAWLIKNGHLDKETKGLYWIDEFGVRKELKVYTQHGSPTSIYVPPLDYQVGYQRGMHCILQRQDPGRSISGQRGAAVRWTDHKRVLPPNVYAMSGGMYIGRRGSLCTKICTSVQEVLELMAQGDMHERRPAERRE